MNQYSSPQGDRVREHSFRSDLEENPTEPRYEPLRPQGGLGSFLKRVLAPLAAVGLLLAKFKGLALLLLKVKFLGTALTMIVSVGAYALLFPLWFAVGFVEKATCSCTVGSNPGYLSHQTWPRTGVTALQ